jgi:hypothetical protein
MVVATPKNYVHKRQNGQMTDASVEQLKRLHVRTKRRADLNKNKPPGAKVPRKGAAKAERLGGAPKHRFNPPKKLKIKEGIPGQAQLAYAGKCAAKTRAGGKCQQAAGFGTDHPGLGRCKYHGGSTRVGFGHAVQERAQLMGAPIDMNPIEAIIWSIRITAGEVKWLSEKIAELDEKEGIENTIVGKQFHLYVRERRDRVALLYRMGNDALKLGLAERAIKMAEMYGIALSRFIMGVLDDLQLTPEQAQMAPQVVRKHLVILEGRKSVDPGKVIEEAIEDAQVEEVESFAITA